MEKLLVQYDSTDKKSTFATDALHQIADRIHQRSLVVIFSDMFDTGKPKEELFSALQHLKHNKHEVLMFHVTDKSKEVDFNYENRPYRFVDMESGEELKIHPNEVKQNYITAINDFRQELKFRCSQYHIDLVEADINEGFNLVLLSYLIKREKLL